MGIRTFEDLSTFKARRQKLEEVSENSVFILFSGKESHLSRFRAQSHFVYMTGFEEPEACVVLRPGRSPEYTLFVRDKDPSIELWDGYRYGPEEAKSIFNADQSFSINDLAKELPNLISGSDQLYYNLGEDTEYDEIVLQSRKRAQQLDRRSGRPQVVIADPNDPLGELRVVKDEFEIGLMKDSCELSALAHNEVMKAVKPGMNEVQVQAHLFYKFFEQKAQREGYSSIIASGVNATVLHYRANNKDLVDGEFLLIDAGAEKNYYTADITRTYPVNGQFTEPQKKLYQAVLDVQKSLIPMAQPGFSLPQLQEKAVQLLTEQMVELDLLIGRPSDLIESKAYQKYYPHGIGHYLGMDVHDVGKSKVDGQPNPFQENMVITIE
ncbi:MAG: aminopeptidase P family protein, partial [Bdellovibrionales bacterium]|nr:aminopeptidase P family protein [Bdellovibrionales bacterium]